MSVSVEHVPVRTVGFAYQPRDTSRHSKFEARNPKLETMTKIQISKFKGRKQKSI